MDLNRIKYFITLAEQLHFGHAAEQLYISQSSLSYHISALEQELGAPLFIRNKRKVLLSSVGTELLPMARKVLEDVAQLERVACEQRGYTPTVERLNICFDSSFERFDLLGIHKAISNLREAYPKMAINIELRDLPRLLEGTQTMDFDIGIGILRSEEKVNDLLNILPLYEDNLILVHNIHDTIGRTAEELLMEQTLYLTRGDARWTDYIINFLTEKNIAHSPALMSNFGDILTHVYLGEGVVALPETQYKAEALTRPGLCSTPLNNASIPLRTCAFWAKGNYNYAITCMLAGIQISPEVSSLLW